MICCSVDQSCPILCDPMDWSTPGFPVLHHLPELPQTYVHSLSWWCHPTVSSSVVPFFSCLKSFPAWGSFPMSQFFTSGGFTCSISPSSEYSGLISFRIEYLISLQSKGLSRVFSNTTVQKHQFFSAEPSLWSSSYIHTWLLEKQRFSIPLEAMGEAMGLPS